jgi:PBP1b-binding outer membrane lipoprotein LpoB
MVKFLPLSLSLALLALLAACGSRQPAPVVIVPPAPVVTTAPAATAPVVAPAAVLRPGFGRIESMAPVSTAASAGGTAPASMQRLNIRMDDGSMQVVDTASGGLAIGDRVELTREGYIRRHPQS